MNDLKATKRLISTSGNTKKLRREGNIPAILYGGSKSNLNISLRKILLKDIIKTDSFMSRVVALNIDGNLEKVLPRDVAYDPRSDEPIHIDFMRIVKGSKLTLEIPVKFMNHDASPGLKKGGVLNIVRRKIELTCPAENIPEEIVVNLDNTEIGTSIKISAVTLPENVSPVITDRNFVVATIASPSIVIEPEKVTEETAEGEIPAEDEDEKAVEGEKEKADEKGKTAKPADDKTKSTKPSDDKAKPPDDKTKSSGKETGKKNK